ncbi:MAG TPA: YbfB/YjiJ family MFS transporter [Albitalea sp.]|uniref:YbfB/YjiJ family MFS transporter n=1 Tax=Piscinibacter sp. TaxID=1903157 RepID=UPI002ECFC585
MQAPEDSATGRAVWTGLAGLAAAMGIGRFAFTPLLPLMQADGLTLSQGAWLAGANYLGYLLGALACAALDLRPQRAAHGGLLAVALTTLPMGLEPSFPLALVLRWGAGMASAFVLVGISAWSLAWLAARGRVQASGTVYAGVGVGMVVAGLVAMGVALAGMTAATGWWLLGGLAAAVTALTWRVLQTAPPIAPAAASTGAEPPARHIGLVVCYGAFGFGYILPATFLPAMARELIADPARFGWTWPVFGLAAALSTWGAGALFGQVAPRKLWAGSQVVMAAGVLISAGFAHSLAALIVSAVCVGGTFMVATMAGLREARRVGGAAAPRLMAWMTAAFATGQFVGPLTVGAAGPQGLAVQSAIAAALLLASSAALLSRREAGTLSSPSRTESS